MPEPEKPKRLKRTPDSDLFPGPFAAVWLSFLALFSTSLMFTLFGEELDFISSIGLAQTLGLGSVALLAARRIPPPHVERIGLRGFPLARLLPLLCLLPVVILIKEFDNYIGVLMPASPAVLELQAELAELTRIDSAYAAAQTVIVAVGISPLVEGFFFFGVILQGLVARLGGVRGVLITAVLYSVVHFPASGAPGSDALVPLASGLTVGALLALARLGSGSLLGAVGLSGAIAAVYLAAAELSDGAAIAGFNAPGEHIALIWVLPSAVAVLYGIRVLLRFAAQSDIAPPVPAPTPQEEDENNGFFL
ncbi:MAG: hypothetical protein CBC48_10260 [bacterium TMED88]|nr:hypothetical protein [Deltaproteobacteria bacterium]OUV30711.1 MAG: hypothetical protein CBC48_10260 [bacterium TMED88]